MQRLMMKQQASGLRAYFIWLPILASDNRYVARKNSIEYASPNSVQYWSPTQKLAQDMAPVLGLGAGRLAWDMYLLYGRNVIWEVKPPAPSYWQHQLSILQGEPFNVAVLGNRVAEALRKN